MDEIAAGEGGGYYFGRRHGIQVAGRLPTTWEGGKVQLHFLPPQGEPKPPVGAWSRWGAVGPILPRVATESAGDFHRGPPGRVSAFLPPDQVGGKPAARGTNLTLGDLLQVGDGSVE